MSIKSKNKQSGYMPTNWKAIIWERSADKNSCDGKFLCFDSVEKGTIFDSMSGPFSFDDMMVLVFCYEGEAHFAVDMREYELKAPFMITIRNKKIGEIHFLSDNYKAFYYCLSEDFANNLFYQLHDTYEFNRSVRERPAFCMDDKAMENIKLNRQLIMAALAEQDNQQHTIEAVRCLIQSLYFTYKHRYFETSPRNIVVGRHAENTVNRFLALVRDNYNKERELAFYAGKLCMTPKYLSRIVKQSTGKTAYSWLTDAVIQEAKMLLKCSDKTIYEISEQLGFSSQVFFSKYFKNATGLSPRDYRKSVE